MKKIARWLVAACLLFVLSAMADQQAAQAGAYTYSTTRRVFKVGMLVLKSTGEENPDPYVFYFADARADLKPLNWEFVNPLAPKNITADIYKRWSAPGVGRDPAHPYQIGQNVAKNMAAYWEVSLSKATIEDLVQYDLLFITNHRLSSFTPEEREKLRKVVDAGGVIWLEDCGSMKINPAGRFFLDDLQFGGDNTTLGESGPEINAPNHPILTSPYRLTYDEIARLGDKNYGNYHLQSQDDANKPPNPETLLNIVGNTGVKDSAGNGLPYIAAGSYGSGAVIATSSDSGCEINDYAGGVNVGSGGNSGAFSGPNLQTAHTEDLKFVYNLVAWGGAGNSDRRNPRRTASSFEAVGAPLVTRFDLTTPLAGDPAAIPDFGLVAPLLVKDVIFVAGVVSDGNELRGTLRAYDAQPYNDRDNDGNPDDGRPDLMGGTSYDEIWRVDDLPVSGTAAKPVYPSTPTFATIRLLNGNIAEVLFITLPNGTLRAYNAFPNTAGRFSTTSSIVYAENKFAGTEAFYPVSPNSPNGTVAPSPVYHEGRVFVTQPNSLVRCIDATDGESIWFSGDPATFTGLNLVPTGPATVGYTRLQAAGLGANSASGTPSSVYTTSGFSNTLDLMLYQPVQETTAKIGRILPYWLGTRNEVLTTPASREPEWIYASRVALGGNRYFTAKDGDFLAKPRPRVFVTEYRPDGTIIKTARQNYEEGNASTYTAQFLPTSGGPLDGRIQITPNPVSTAPANAPVPLPADHFIVALDYDVLYYTDPTGTETKLSYGKPAGLNDDGSRDQTRTLQTRGESDPDSSLRTLALSPDDLLIYSTWERASLSGTPVASVFAANEQFNVGATKLRWRFALNTPASGTLNGVTIADQPPLGVLNNGEIKPIGAPIVTNNNIAYVLADAGGQSVLMAFQTNQEITLNVGPMDPSRPPTVAQIDALEPGNTVTLQQNQYTVDATRGKITITNFQPATGGRAVSASQSFVVTVTLAGSSASITQIHAPLNSDFGDDFTPLLWYYVLDGAPLSSPTLIGDYIYFTQGAGNASQLVAAEANPIDALLNRAQLIPIGNHIRVLSIPAPNDPSGNPFPLKAAAAPVGAQGVLIINSDHGFSAFEEGITLVADSKRVIEVKADGTAVWALDSTFKYTVVGGELPIYRGNGTIVNEAVANGRVVQERKSISRPLSVRRLSQADLLIADTGNNRCVRVDRAGKVIWDLERVSDPYDILASGDPVTLSSPSDIQFWIVYTYDANGKVSGYEAHYLIADAGHFRLIEVMDRYNAQGELLGTGEVVWTTRTASKQGRQLRFQNVERFIDQTGDPVVVAVITNLSAAAEGTTANADFTGGGLARIDYKPYRTTFYRRDRSSFVLWPAAAPGVPATSTEPKNNGLILTAIDDLRFLLPNGQVDPDPNRIKRVTRPVFLQQFTLPDPSDPPREKNVYLLCDAEGVYQFERIGPDRVITWQFTKADYDEMNRRDPDLGGPALPRLNRSAGLPDFLPSSVRRLPSGHYLITNAFTGSSTAFLSGQFLGEVFEVKPGIPNDPTRGGTFANFNAPQIVLEPSNNTDPVYRQQMGGPNKVDPARPAERPENTASTNPLEQPLYADRLF